MLKLRQFFGLVGILAFWTVCSSAVAVDRITATVAITNAPTTNGQTFAVNGSTRTWTNNVVLSSVQVLTNATAAGAKTNLYTHIALNRFSQVTLVDRGSTNFDLVGAAGLNLTVALSAGWGSVSYSTQAVAALIDVRVPISGEPSGGQGTNIASLVVKGANDLSTNSFFENSTAVQNLLGRTNNQSLTGEKQFNSTNYFKTINATNFFHQGGTFQLRTSPSGHQFDIVPETGAYLSFYWDGIAMPYLRASRFVATNGFWGNVGELTNGVYRTPILDTALITNATIIGGDVSLTNPIITHSRWVGTNTFAAGSDISFGRYSLSTLANGNNAGIVVGTNVFVDVSGPSGAFTINGIAGGRDGKFIVLINLTGQNMTIAHDSGVDPTAANRIYTLTGADRATTGNGAAMLWYNANVSRWVCFALDQ